MIISLIAAAAISGPTALVLKGLDPIELARGHEVAGSPKLTYDYLRYRYQFANEQNLAKFRAAPQIFGVQMGGACGKMGALTGKGSPDRWAVARGKVFLFASDGCRTTFLGNESAYFGSPRQAPRATVPQQRAARAAFDRMLQAHGGAGKIGKVASAEWNVLTPYKDNGQDKIWDSRTYFSQKGLAASWEVWDAGMAFFALAGTRSSEGKQGEAYGIHPDEADALRRLMVRTPIGILTGGRSSAQMMGEPASIEGEPCHVIVVQRWGAVSDVFVSQKSGRIVGIRYHDRYRGPFADVQVMFSDYEQIDGVWLPKRSKARANGGAWGKEISLATMKLNGAEPPVFAAAFPK